MNFLTNLNLNKNQLQNAVIQPLAVAPSNPTEGQIYYNSSDKLIYQYSGVSGGWKPVGELNVIEDIKINGVSATITNRSVSITTPEASNANPQMNGTADSGSSTLFARADHVHPSDTSRLPLAGGTMSGDIDMGGNGITGLPTPTNNSDAATKQYVDDSFGAQDAMIFKGTLGEGGSVAALPNPHVTGWTYRVVSSGTYAGNQCEIGDLLICVRDGTTASDSDWTVAQTNVDGAVIGPASSTAGHIPVFSGTSGKVLADGFAVSTEITEESTDTELATAKAVYDFSVKTAVGTIGTTARTTTVSYTGTLVNAYATMASEIVQLDITISATGVAFTTTVAPSSPVTCTVVYI